MPPRDPRLRPYRAALWILYFTVVVGGVTLVTVSVARTLRDSPRPARAAPAGELATRAALRVCLTDLEVLYREQNGQAWALAAEMERPDPIARWQAWARAWEARLEDLADRCRLDAPGPGAEAAARAELAAARDALLALHRAYGSMVTRFGAEHGDLAQAAAESLAHAREAVARQK